MRKNSAIISGFLSLLSLTALHAQSNWFEAGKEEAVISSVTATSELVEGQYDGKYLYPPVNILDNDFNTTWCESDPDGAGIGESITVSFKEAVSFDELQIVNGFASGSDYYGKNNRVKGIKITQTAGNHFQQKEYTLKDGIPGWQSIRFDLLQTAQTITLKITDVYRGSKYNDTCLCDIRILYKGKVIPFKNVERIKKVQEEASRFALKNSEQDFRKQLYGLFQKYNADELYFLGSDPEDSLRISINGKTADKFSVSSMARVSFLKAGPKDTVKNEIQKIFKENSFDDTYYSWDSFSSDYDQSKYDWVCLECFRMYWPKRYTEYSLGNWRILTSSQIDYVDVTTVTLVKIDGATVFIDGVPYTVPDPARVKLVNYGDDY